MIPPLTPGQSEEQQQNMVGWKNTFNMRHVTLMNLAASHLAARNGTRAELPAYRRGDCMMSPAKSLDILRKNLQSAINKDIEAVIKKYLEKFFQPAVSNIRNNLGKDSVNEDHIKDVCRQMLEEAKAMYKINSVSRESSPYDYSDSETPASRKRKESDTDSETGNFSGNNQKRHKLLVALENSTHRLPAKREGPKWDSQRINSNTLFIMGAKANKVLGFGQTRGRLYVRHPELVRYSGDQEDKEWLAGKNLMPASGGKAYLMLLEDIQELTASDDYKNSPNLQLGELKGFEVPEFLVNKVKAFVESVRTDKRPSGLEFFEFQHSQSPMVDSAPSTPSDTTLQMLESQSVSTTSSKQSDNNFAHMPEMSPGSNNSLMSGHLTQSPMNSSSSLLSPNMLISIANSDAVNNNSSVMVLNDPQSDASLSSLLTGQICNDNSQEF